MTSGADQALIEALAGIERALSKVGAPHMVVGGLAVIARGIARHTDDVDATVWAPGLNLDALWLALADEAFEGRVPDAREFAEHNQVLLLRHVPTGTPAEVLLAWLPFEREAIERATDVQIRDVTVRVATPEDLVVYKAVAWRDRDRADVERLLHAYASEISLDRVRQVVGEFATALEEPERLRELDHVIQRVNDSK